jgi:ParB family chromosome partitioning protein
LGALIPADLTDSDADADQPQLVDIPVGSIEPNPNQPRVHFDEETLNELAASIAEVGLLQPILVRPAGEGRYQLVAGERRWRAARRAGLTAVPAVVRTTDDLSSIEHALVENLHRQDLTPLEEAAAYQQLIEDFELTHEQVAARVGRSRSTVSNTLRLLTLPPAIQHLLADGRLSAGHARALLGTPDRAFQEQLARRAAQEGWSVRAVEDAVRARQQTTGTASPVDEVEGEEPAPAPRPPAPKLRPPGLLELEGLLAERLATRVAITMGSGKGRVVVDFADLEDLERIYHVITGGPVDGD